MFSALHRKIICNVEVPKLFVRVANVRILGYQEIHTSDIDNFPKKSSTKTVKLTEDKLINYKKSRINIAKIMASKDVDSSTDSEKKKRRNSGINFENIGDGISIVPWSCSGVETCVVVKTPHFRIAFDMGYPFKIAVTCEHVFISHGHMDHIANIVSHASKRSLYGMKPATYYMAEHLVEPIQQLAALYGKIHNDENKDDLEFSKLNIKPVDFTTAIDLPKKHFVKAFKTVHRVRSQGYIIYRRKKGLKPEYVGEDIGQLIKDGVNVHSEEVIPEIAYTGDTTFETFRNPENTDLFKVKLLITEATYIDNETDKLGRGGVERANARGHTHVQQIIDNEKLFDKVSKILLIHFSDKYSVNYIRGKLETILPPSLKSKIILGTLWKETFG